MNFFTPALIDSQIKWLIIGVSTNGSALLGEIRLAGNILVPHSGREDDGVVTLYNILR